jgi:hypothetical protein
MKVENGKITFRWRDYAERNQNKIMTLEVFEFIRRFLLHVLPKGYFKIRYYEILGSRNLKTKLQICKELLNPDQEEDLECHGCFSCL